MSIYSDYAADIAQDQQIREAIANAEEAVAQVNALTNSTGGAGGGTSVAVIQINNGTGTTAVLIAPGVYRIDVSGVIALAEGTGIDLTGTGTITVKVDIAISTPIADPGTIPSPAAYPAPTISAAYVQAEVQGLANEIATDRATIRAILGALTN